jgi:uncharacterized oxidoreductase
MPLIRCAQLKPLLVEVYEANDVPSSEAEVVARLQVSANLAGHDSHGVIQTPAYVRGIKAGNIVPGALFDVERSTPTTAVINGHWGFGYVQTERAMKLAIQKARTAGIGAVTIRYQGHIGRLGAYAEMAAEAGMLGLLMADSGRGPKQVVPFGGRTARLGTNPICFSVPRNSGPPLLLDMATCAVASGKMRLALNRGVGVAPGLAIDANGEPTTDPNKYFEGGALLPLGGEQVGHKGYGLSCMVETYCGLLTGLGFGVAADGVHNDGVYLMAIDPGCFRDPREFGADVDAFVDYLKDSPPAPGVSEVFYPGELEARNRAERSANGINVDSQTWSQLQELRHPAK